MKANLSVSLAMRSLLVCVRLALFYHLPCQLSCDSDLLSKENSFPLDLEENVAGGTTRVRYPQGHSQRAAAAAAK